MNDMMELSLYFITEIIKLIPTTEALMFIFGLTMFAGIVNILDKLIHIKK